MKYDNLSGNDNVSRRNFLKLLGASLASHFLFLNYGAANAHAGDIEPKPPLKRCGTNTKKNSNNGSFCDNQSITDVCGAAIPGGQPGQVWSDFCSAVDPDKCGETGSGGPIPDNCNELYSNYDKCGCANQGGGYINDTCVGAGNLDFCGGLNAGQGVINDNCLFQVEDEDKCGGFNQAPDPGIISDTCGIAPSYFDFDKCGLGDEGGSVISDNCGGTGPELTNKDCCGEESFQGSPISDSGCSPEGQQDEDKCGAADFSGNAIPDSCDNEDNPDKCGQDDCNGNKISDTCEEPDPDQCRSTTCQDAP